MTASNPNGIASLSPGLRRSAVPRRYPGKTTPKQSNPESGCIIQNPPPLVLGSSELIRVGHSGSESVVKNLRSLRLLLFKTRAYPRVQ
jgi:hypothetical protein